MRKDLATTQQLVEMAEEQNKDSTLFTSMRIDTKNQITSFESIGWADPEDTKSMMKASKWLKSLTHDNFIFNREAFNASKVPFLIFVPDEALLNRMIELVAKSPNEQAEGLLIKFCDFLPPKPQWMTQVSLENKRQKAIEDGISPDQIKEESSDDESDDDQTNE